MSCALLDVGAEGERVERGQLEQRLALPARTPRPRRSAPAPCRRAGSRSGSARAGRRCDATWASSAATSWRALPRAARAPASCSRDHPRLVLGPVALLRGRGRLLEQPLGAGQLAVGDAALDFQRRDVGARLPGAGGGRRPARHQRLPLEQQRDRVHHAHDARPSRAGRPPPARRRAAGRRPPRPRSLRSPRSCRRRPRCPSGTRSARRRRDEGDGRDPTAVREAHGLSLAVRGVIPRVVRYLARAWASSTRWRSSVSRASSTSVRVST